MTRSRWPLVGLLLAGYLLAGCGGDEGDTGAAGTTTTAASAPTSTTATTATSGEATTTTAGFSGTVIEVRVTGDRVETASRRVRVDRGEKVQIRVQADRAEEVHLHGYDLSEDVAPGKPAVIEFTADAAGVFEVELEQAKLPLFELQVQ
jgi:FtsP/CotA-like multicopper oxidase with cupredoxin domain